MRIDLGTIGRLAALVLATVLAACGGRPAVRPPVSGPVEAAAVAGAVVPGRLTPVAWQQVPGWEDDSLIGAAAALRENCSRLARERNWQRACAAAAQLDDLDVAGTRSFFEAYFTPFQFANGDGTLDGLVTGYYEPLLHGSRTRHGAYQYPLYRWPAGYRAGTALPARAQLERAGVLAGNELVWVDDPIEGFFLQVQGSGRIVLDDGSVMRVGYGGSNNQPYKSIGRWLLDHGELTPAQATMQGIKAWARANPGRVDALLDTNPRFVFFREMPAAGSAWAGSEKGPIGALGVPLTPQRSIAVDPASIPLGTPVFLQTTRPMTNAPLNRLVFAQDTGTAIKGGVRADYFWGLGDDAGDLAGKMKQTGRMWLLLPNS
ncbi:MltA domain-containing protein [Trinickia caryophylli]|uniref:peptidoglycan lytic exotransglycosylase n=1 Tax=Trinickia caryophylli TaxID=28094 RepID=A0A1X7F1Y3_TRICW|nr:MltA domain-containing protein [Trinickia caryophylli]PMS10330.1 transglycosylase [Trinickia caryophylli]TRX19549.1 transglycosylase [Trinickia caryophylli]WQE13141.1 MltA domain-containing protein [Trinickia caryophylli]SMF43864.1 membrane-bound lytic murein transglycosylase A [Trinickia caryophylli]GLU34560.1 murein transglycosylase [Trinickia caryophylli]